MNLQTNVEINSFPKKINHKNQLFLIGSCFTESIGEKLLSSKFNILCNPFGIIYNPISIKNSFEILEKKKLFKENDLFNENGVWKSFFHHSRFSNTDLDSTLKNINESICNSNLFLQKTDYVFITLGTSWVYELIEKNIIVSNCHKTPANKFKRRLLNINEIVDSLNSVINILQNINQNIKIIFTISPVRHLKDGIQGNTISKSLLFSALHTIKENNSSIIYFPAYEILIDELRDYRFYADDMIHPSSKAIEFIWEKFCNTFLIEETINLNKEIDELRRAMQHKPFFSETEEYKNFKNHNFVKTCDLSGKHPYLNFQSEKDFFNFE